MDKYRFIDNILMPFMGYLFVGLFVAECMGVTAYTGNLLLCALVAGVMLGLQGWFSNKLVTVVILCYVVLTTAFGLMWGEGLYRELVLLFLISMGGIWLLRYLMGYRLFTAFLGYAALAGLLVSLFLECDNSKGTITLGVFLLLCSLSETLSFFYRGNAKTLVFVFALVSAITVALPTSQEPYDWAFVFNMMDVVRDFSDWAVEEIRYLLDINNSRMGYSGNILSVSEKALEQDSVQLELQGHRTARNMYMRGAVYDEFTGHSWEKTVDEDGYYPVDTLMTLYAIFDTEEDYFKLREFMDVKTQTITLNNIRTHALFSPMKLIDISVEGTLVEGECPETVRLMEKGDRYTYTFLDIDYASPVIKDILQKSGDIIYEEAVYNRMYERMEEYFHVSMPQIPYQDFLAEVEICERRATEQYRAYEGDISEEVVALADVRTQGMDNVFHICKELESCFGDYSYSTEIEMPYYENTVDWFLLDGKEGYCVHFASALTMMLRSVGVPARLAEGYLVDYDRHIDGYTYAISSNRVHAWVEAYVEGFGWLRLEPTIIYTENANRQWYHATDGEEEEIESERIESEPPEEEAEPVQGLPWEVVLVFLGGMLVLLGVTLLVLWCVSKERQKRNMEPEKVLGYVIRIFEKRYLSRSDGETLREYLHRLGEYQELSDEIRPELPRVREIMEAFWYGGRSPSKEEIEFLKHLTE